MLTKKDIEELKQIKGMIKGENIKENFKCFLIMEGKNGLEKLEERMKELDFLTGYRNLENIKWYPLGSDVAIIALAAEVFEWDESKLKEFGRYFVKASFAEKIFIKYFISAKKMFTTASEHWRRHFTVGDLTLKELNLKKKYAILELKDFDVRQASYCQMLMGFFEGTTLLTISSENIWTEETKCMARGDEFHEYKLNWR